MTKKIFTVTVIHSYPKRGPLEQGLNLTFIAEGEESYFYQTNKELESLEKGGAVINRIHVKRVETIEYNLSLTEFNTRYSQKRGMQPKASFVPNQKTESQPE